MNPPAHKPRAPVPHELILAALILGLALFIGLLNPAFFSRAHLYDLIKGSTVMGLFALGVLLVMISGGIDISFTSIAVFAMYVTSRGLVAVEYQGTVLVAFVISAAIGLALGGLNALFVAGFGLPTLIVTLGTAGLIRGLLLAFIGTEILNQLPAGYARFSRLTWFEHTLPGGDTVGLSPIFLVFLLAAAAVALLLRYTMVGRGIYALGGNPSAAERVGFNVPALRLVVFGLAGGLAGLAGLAHATMMRNANPFDLVGMELMVLAAVVLGGAGIFGGRGTVTGTILGVLLLVLLNNSLILLGIPTYWQRVFVGLILLVATGISAHRENA
ncbi:MAG: ABC transporter permease [Verrucomicrobia bacterium]|nr:ABC transporter permease [Verrucomicrobiota bacterium]